MVGCLPTTERPELVIASNFQNPPEREYLLSLAQQYGVNLRLEGNVSEETLVRLYNQAAVTVYAPVREPFGFVPLESLACEVPVLAVKEGGVQETIQDGLSGYLVERDAALFASALQKLLKNPSLREQFGSQGRQMVLTDWSWDKSVASLEAIFREVSKPTF